MVVNHCTSIHAASVYIFRHFWTDEHYICFREDENEGKGSLSLFRLKEMKVGRSYSKRNGGRR